MYSVHICTVCSQIYRASSHIHGEPPMSSVISDSATCPGLVFLYLPESCVSVYLQHICVCVVCFCISSTHVLCVVVQRKGKSCTSRINSRGLTNGKLGRFQKPVNPSEMVCTQMGMRKNKRLFLYSNSQMWCRRSLFFLSCLMSRQPVTRNSFFLQIKFQRYLEVSRGI